MEKIRTDLRVALSLMTSVQFVPDGRDGDNPYSQIHEHDLDEVVHVVRAWILESAADYQDQAENAPNQAVRTVALLMAGTIENLAALLKTQGEAAPEPTECLCGNAEGRTPKHGLCRWCRAELGTTEEPLLP